MLRKFKIKLNGEEYYVEMEELDAPNTQQPTPSVVEPSQPVAQPVVEEKVTPQAQPEPQPQSTASAAVITDNTLTAPMPGKIIKVLLKEGTNVEINQPIMVLEAMKMENEIVANKAGTLSKIHVTVGQSVNAGDALFTIDE
ncbi:biotin/lipoyl-containing protein [Fundicoccus culcitae]|uniref:Biotin/lipoyl-binding protein n=1 Tax=Fundicoccus culcitae TaxID=2969821 RepID=A0ABY5P9T7_9LACT|nr:biotin/lipoyl-containing protein [Fundicoccus culcitae]UUX35434.1 biotin/lipoyl-binding protein [Fundicoccus culcitae]